MIIWRRLTTTDGRTADCDFYNGPDKIWIFVDKDTGKSDTRSRLLLTEEENGADFPTPEDQFKIEVDCATDPVQYVHYYDAYNLNGKQ